MVARRLQFGNQLPFPCGGIPGDHFSNPVSRLQADNARIIPIEVIKQSLANVSFSNIHPGAGHKQPVDSNLVRVQSLNVPPRERLWCLLNKWHPSTPLSPYLLPSTLISNRRELTSTESPAYRVSPLIF